MSVRSSCQSQLINLSIMHLKKLKTKGNETNMQDFSSVFLRENYPHSWSSSNDSGCSTVTIGQEGKRHNAHSSQQHTPYHHMFVSLPIILNFYKLFAWEFKYIAVIDSDWWFYSSSISDQRINFCLHAIPVIDPVRVAHPPPLCADLLVGARQSAADEGL